MPNNIYQSEFTGAEIDARLAMTLRGDASFGAQITKENATYKITDDFDLNGDTVTIPAGCTLSFEGGSLSNGTLALNYTLLDGMVKTSCAMTGTAKNRMLMSSWFSDPALAVSNARALSIGICVDKGFTLSAPLSFFGIREVDIRGTITNTAENYIEIGYNSGVATSAKVDIWNVSYIKMTGGKNMEVTVRNCNTFTLEVNNATSQKTSISYCTFLLGYVANFAMIGHGTGWINENAFIKGRFISTFTIQGDDYAHNNNVFYNPTFEGSGLTISLEKCRYNSFHDVRLEGSPTFVFGNNASNNRFYRSWLENGDSLMRKYYGPASTNKNGIYFDDATITKCFTLNRDSYIGGRDLDKVSLCDDNKTIRHENSDTYLRFEVRPKGDFGVAFASDNGGMSRTNMSFEDTAGERINTDDLTSYIHSFGGFTRVATNPDAVYYRQQVDATANYFEVEVDAINRYLKNTYGVDDNGNPLKKLGLVKFGFYPNNVRKVFNYVDVRIIAPANVSDNAAVLMNLPFAAPQNISTAKPTIKSTISGTAVPYSLLDGESCLRTSNNVIYRRVGSSILIEGTLTEE